MKCRSREEMPTRRNEVDILLTKMVPRYLALFPNIGENMAEILEPKNIFKGLINGILGSTISTTELSEVEELGSFLKALYEVCLTYQAEIGSKRTIPKLENLNPELYYEENELSSINLYVKDMPKDGNIVTFNVVKNSEKHYVCPRMELPEYTEYFDRGSFNYNINTQRETTKTIDKKTQEVIEKITIFKKNIKEMVEDLKNNKFHPNNLILSIRKNGHEVYDDDGLQVGQMGQLKVQVTGKSFLDINDGMNRTMAFREFVKLVPNTTKYTGIDIFVCDEKEALEIITQANKGEKIKEEVLVRKDVANIGMKMATELNDTGTMLRGKIATDLVDIIAYNKYTDILTLGDMINFVFGEDVKGKPTEAFELTQYLAEFYDFAIDYYRDYFNNKLVLNQDFYQRKNLVATICCIAKIIKDKERWKTKLFNILNNTPIDALLKITPNNKILKHNHIKTISNKINNLLKEEVAL